MDWNHHFAARGDRRDQVVRVHAPSVWLHINKDRSGTAIFHSAGGGHPSGFGNQHLVPGLQVHRAQLETIAPNSQGIILGIKPFQYSSYEEICSRSKSPMLLVALDGVTDPRNLGAVTRSAAAFGASGISIPERRAAAMTASAWKTSAGAAARLPIAQVTNLARTIDDAKKRGMFVIGLDGDSMSIVGSEGKGLARLTREKCDLIVSIPISSSTESLNASVATSIALFWIDEQRRKG